MTVEIEEAVKALPDPKELSRDEFAAAALTGFIANDSEDQACQYSRWSYEIADAMIEARKQK